MENKYMPTIRQRGFRLITCLVMGAALGLMFGSVVKAQQASSQATPKPGWPDNGIAQRMFPNSSNMFVENDHGSWHAWVLELKNGNYIQALDFFSGKQLRVRVKLIEDGTQDFAFTDAEGKIHAGEDKGFNFSGPAIGGGLIGVNFGAKTLHIDGINNQCDVTLNSVESDHKNNTNWDKFPIYHNAAVRGGCVSGDFESFINTALDLGDGTFLASQGCWIFRLHKSDLSPVGSAPALRIVDEAALRAIIDQNKGKPIQDAAGHLAKALNLPTIPELSCKEG